MMSLVSHLFDIVPYFGFSCLGIFAMKLVEVVLTVHTFFLQEDVYIPQGIAD